MPPTSVSLVQRLHLAPLDAVPEELYVATTGSVLGERSSARLGPWSTLSTRTYFGRVPVSYLQRWTRITSLEVVLSVRGRGRVQLVAQDHLPGTRVVDRIEVDATEAVTVRLGASVQGFLDLGQLWLEAATTEGELEIADVRVETPAPAEQRSLTVVICTFNRPDDCTATLARLGSDPVALALVGRIVVVDQGDRLVEEADGFGAASASLGERLTVLRQGNFGGAGGFARGLMEARAAQAEGSGSVILMDDDIRLEPDSLVRLAAVDAHRRHPVIVGGQMLALRHPSVLLTHGERTDLADLRGGVPVDPELAGLDLLEHLPTSRIDVEYNAWWLCLLPLEVVDEIGLPMPIFFQGDDLEMGLRARAAGVPTITLPGAAVWHEDFQFKNWDSPLAFFAIRNGLINAALRTDLVPGGVHGKLEERLRHQIVEHRYGLTATALAAIDAFLTGPSVLARGSAGDLAAAVALRADHPDTFAVTIDELREQGLDQLWLRRHSDTPPDHEHASWRRFLGQARGRMLGEVALPAEAPWWFGSSYRTIVSIDQSQDSFRVRRYSRPTALEQIRASRRMLKRLRAEGPAVAQRWRDAQAELTSTESWRRILELD